MKICGWDGGPMTRCAAMQFLADRYVWLAVRLAGMGEPDLARFYRNVADGMLGRLSELSLSQCMEVLR